MVWSLVVSDPAYTQDRSVFWHPVSGDDLYWATWYTDGSSVVWVVILLFFYDLWFILVFTGASSGIGKACAYYFAQHRHNLILIARRWDRLQEIKNDLVNLYKIEILIWIVDVSSYKQVDDFFDWLKDVDINILINNAWLAKGFDYVSDLSIDHLNQMIDTNIKGVLYISKKVIPLMIKKGLHIFNIWSISANHYYPGGAAYCATKAAVNSLSQCMRLELQASNIMVTCINPGLVNTQFQYVRTDGDWAQVDAFLQKRLWTGTQLEPVQIASLLYDLVGKDIPEISYRHKI